MRRIMMVLTVALVMAAMVVASALPAFAVVGGQAPETVDTRAPSQACHLQNTNAPLFTPGITCNPVNP